MEKRYEATINVTKELWEYINQLEAIEDLEALTDDQLDELEAREDDSGESLCWEFTNGRIVTMQQYSGSTNYWCEMWIDDEYDDAEVIEELSTVMDFVDHETNTIYRCKINLI